ncbi:hypothetical protein TNCV_1119741 [Trichonephila clavipes]|uniref:Tc3 transposase DNA binding domain-containing protein n=1 Tax=Trichonephila clavipes TaxID=2585209 RepID=A0A8X6SZ99_TRICX|nr:hypothetical protein TNCV_1119741 [Trichonephila clavipes]
MTDLSEFEKGMIVGMRSAGCSVTETAIYLRRARSTVSAVMTAYKKCGNVTSGKHSSGRKRKLTDSVARGVEHTDSEPHNSSNKSSGRMNRRSPYSKPPDAFM